MTEQIEIVFNFDTTGSMYSCLAQVRKNLEQLIGNLFKEIPNLRIGIGANGDYCDAGKPYVTTTKDLSTDLYSLVKFAREVEKTFGGDAPEAYELVLHEAIKKYSWSVNSKKILVLIGDDVPHGPSYHLNKDKINWKVAARTLAENGIQVYTIQCLSRRHADYFYTELADITGGYRLQLDQFSEIETLINAITYQQQSPARLQQYEEKVASTGKMSRSLDTAFGVLSGKPRDSKGRFVAYKNVTDKGETLVPVEPGRFQILEVESDAVIRDFVAENDLIFQPGKGFYEFTKRETIQDKKEIVIRNKVSGDMFSGAHARELLGIPYGMGKSKISPKHGDKYDVFVQSTSYNRKLVGGTRFLYEVDMSA